MKSYDLDKSDLANKEKSTDQNSCFLKLRQCKVYRFKVIASLWILWSFCLLGWMCAQFPPSFSDLRYISGVNIADGSWFVTFWTGGILAGSMLCGIVFDKMNKSLFMFLVVATSATIVAVIPWCAVYELMVAAQFIRGIVTGLLDPASNALLFIIWGGDGGSFIQGLHFSIAIGSIVSPLVTAPFLMPKPTNRQKPVSGLLNSFINEQEWSIFNQSESIFLNRSSTENHIPELYLISKNEPLFYLLRINGKIFISRHKQINQSVSDSDFQNNFQFENEIGIEDDGLFTNDSSLNLVFNNSVYVNRIKPINSTGNNGERYQSRIYIPYLITTGLQIICAVPFLVNFLWSKDQKSSDEKQEKREIRELPLRAHFLVLFTIGIFFSLYRGIEVILVVFLPTVLDQQVQWSPVHCSTIVSVIYSTLCFGRFSGIFLIKVLNPMVIVLGNIFGMLTSAIGLYISTLLNFDIGIWLCAALAGLSFSITYPTSMSWTDRLLVSVSGRVSSYILVAGSFLSIINPIILGFMMVLYSPMWFYYLLIGEIVLFMLLYLIMVTLTKFIVAKYGRTYDKIPVVDKTMKTKEK